MKNNLIWHSVTAVLRKRFLLLALLLLAIIASMALQLTPAFLIRRIIDQHFVTGQLAGVWSLAALYLLITSGSNVVEFSKVAFTTLIGQSILMDLRTKMAKRLTELPINYFLSTPTGDIMSRLTTDVMRLIICFLQVLSMFLPISSKLEGCWCLSTLWRHNCFGWKLWSFQSSTLPPTSLEKGFLFSKRR